MISILITHYNRLTALETCLLAFKDLGLTNVEYVVTDDGSKAIIQEKLKTIDVDRLILSPVNTGLASNINRGLAACKGDYILYCQEDFIPQDEFCDYLVEALKLLSANKVEMCRFTANYKFPYLKSLSEKFSLIPKFSWKNFHYNAFQYSDHPYITTKNFFEQYGRFLENVSGPYGENEFAIRIMKSNARIGIAKKYVFRTNSDSSSVIATQEKKKKRKFLKKIKVHRLLRSFRLHFEFLLYQPNHRKLITIKNSRSRKNN